MMATFRRWTTAHPAWMLAAATVLALAPFLARPFNVDDPLFLWTAKQILAHPVDPYGFDVNWYGETQPMWTVTQNPPLAAYYLAIGALIFGWNEIGLHALFLLPAVAVVLGTWRLAKSAGGPPVLAGLAALLMPVFLLSSTTVMCDTLMLAFWTWAVVCWVEGGQKKLLLAAVLVSLAALTKYFGACLIPLLAAYSIFLKRPLTRDVGYLLVPLATLGVYQWMTKALYGCALLSQAATFATKAQGMMAISRGESVLAGLAFCGGCLAPAVFLTPWLWRWRTLVILAAASAIICPLVFTPAMFAGHYPGVEESRRLAVQLQLIFWVAGGLAVLGLAIEEFRRRRDAISCLLFLWTFGTFIFAAVCNWTVNGRSILPMAPAVAVLLARRLSVVATGGTWAGWIIAAVLAMVVVRADFLSADAVRQTVRQTVARYADKKDQLLFEGHWGFQYYMEADGMTALDYSRSLLKPGDILAVPENNTGILPPNPAAVVEQDRLTVAGARWAAAMDPAIAAGFYASVRGPLPFAFGKASGQSVYFFHLGTNAPAGK